MSRPPPLALWTNPPINALHFKPGRLHACITHCIPKCINPHTHTASRDGCGALAIRVFGHSRPEGTYHHAERSSRAHVTQPHRVVRIKAIQPWPYNGVRIHKSIRRQSGTYFTLPLSSRHRPLTPTTSFAQAYSRCPRNQQDVPDHHTTQSQDVPQRVGEQVSGNKRTRNCKAKSCILCFEHVPTKQR